MITIGHIPRQPWEEQAGVLGIVAFFYALREFVAWQQGFAAAIPSTLEGIRDALDAMVKEYDE